MLAFLICRRYFSFYLTCIPTLAKMRRTVIALFSLILMMSHIVASEPSTENEDDYIDLFGSTTPRPEDSDTTTPPPFWTSENEYDQVDMVLKREIFALYKIVYPAVLLVATGTTILGLLLLSRVVQRAYLCGITGLPLFAAVTAVTL